jgi:hypothetical protein
MAESFTLRRPGRRRRQYHARSKRTILWLAGTFVVLQLVAGLWFDYVQPRVRFAHLHRQLDKLAARPKSPDILCLGSSRFGTCLIDQELTRFLSEQGYDLEVLNLGVPLGDLVASENTLELLLTRGLRPSLLLLEISPEFLSADNTWLQYHVERHLRWDHAPRFCEDLWRTGQGGKWLEERLLPWYVHRKGYWNAWGDLALRIHRPRHQRSKPLAAADQRREWERALDLTDRTRVTMGDARTEAVIDSFRPSFSPYRPGGGTLRALERILARCKRDQIEVVLIAPPLRRDHRNLYTPEVETSFQACLKRVTTDHIAFWDARQIVPDHHFLDNQHADWDGAMTFTSQLSDAPMLTQHFHKLSRASRDAVFSSK